MEDERLHEVKFAEMQKYIPFLESMVKRLELAGDEVKSKAAQLTKIKSLKGLLLSKKKKMKYDNLLKCEQVLMKLYSKVEKTDFQPTKYDSKDTLECATGTTQTGSNNIELSDKTFDAESFDADELNRCREKLKSITEPTETAVQDRLTMSTNKTPPTVSKISGKNRLSLDLYYDSLSESEDNSTVKEKRNPGVTSHSNSFTNFGRNKAFPLLGNRLAENFRQRSRSAEPGPSMQGAISQPAIKPRIYTRVLKSPERRHSKSPSQSVRSEKQHHFARNEHLSPRSDKLIPFSKNDEEPLSPVHISPRSEIILTSPRGAGFYNRRSPMRLSRELRSRSNSKNDIIALHEKSLSPRSNIPYIKSQIKKTNLTLPVGADIFKRRSPKRISNERRSRSISKKDTYNDQSISPRTEKINVSPRDKLVTSPHCSTLYKRRSPKKQLDDRSSCNVNKEVHRKDKYLPKGSEYRKKKNKSNSDKSSEVDNCETEREMDLLRRIRSQIVCELNATNAYIQIGKLMSKKSLRKEKKKKSKLKVEVEEGEICDSYDELYNNLMRPSDKSPKKNAPEGNITTAESREAKVSNTKLNAFDELNLLPAKSTDYNASELNLKSAERREAYQSNTKINEYDELNLLPAKSYIDESEVNVTSAESLEPNSSNTKRNTFDELNLLPPQSNDTLTQKGNTIHIDYTVNEGKIESSIKPPTPKIVKEDANNSDELDEFFSAKLVEIRKKQEATKDIKQKGKKDIKINFLFEKENRKTNNKQTNESKENGSKGFAPGLFDIMNKGQSSEVVRTKPELKDLDEINRAVEKSSIVEDASLRVSQSDILTALNSEIMMEKINLPLPATGVISTKSIKKDISDSTSISSGAESETKRRISFEKYKEKIGPFVAPSGKDDLKETSKSSQNEYKDHVDLISRALTAKEYERFQSILKSTIDDNISDPEAKLSLRPLNQKSLNDTTKEQSLFDNIFNTSELLPEDLGPQSPDEELVFCDDDSSPPTVIPPDPITQNINAPFQFGTLAPVPTLRHQKTRASDIDMRMQTSLPISGSYASYVKSGPASDVDLFNKEIQSPHTNEWIAPSSSEHRQLPVFTGNKDPRKKTTHIVNVTHASMNSNTPPPYRGLNDVRGGINNVFPNSNISWNRNFNSNSVPASPNINMFEQAEDITHFGENTLNKNSYDHNSSNPFGNRMSTHDRGFLGTTPNQPMGSILNTTHFGDHARNVKPKSSTCWRRGDDFDVHAVQGGVFGIPNYSERDADNLGYKRDETRTAYSSDWNCSPRQFGMPNTFGHGIRDQANVSYYSDTTGQFKPEQASSIISIVDKAAGMGRHEENTSCNDHTVRQFGREYPQGAGLSRTFERGRSVGRFDVGLIHSSERGRTIDRECTPGRVVNQRSFNRETSVGRSLNREPSVVRSFNREASMGPTFNREQSTGRSLNREQSVGRTFNREVSVGRSSNREPSTGRTLYQEPSGGRFFNREPSVGRDFNRELSIGPTFNREQSIGRTFNREPSVERNFIREPSVGRAFDREKSVGRLITREPSVVRDFNRELSVGRSFNREQNIRRSFNREPTIGPVFNREPSIGRALNQEASVGHTINREASVGRTFNRGPSLGKVLNQVSETVNAFIRESSIGKNTCREQSVRQNMNRELSVGRSLHRESSVGRILTREPSIGRNLCREPSIGRTTNTSTSVARTDISRDSERFFDRDRSVPKHESYDSRRRELSKARSPLTNREKSSNNSRGMRSRRELYDQQKASFPKDKYSRDPRLARERGRARHADKDKPSGRYSDYRASGRHSKSPKGFVYTKDNLAKGFSGHSGISNYKIPKIKRETVQEDSDVIFDDNESVPTSNETAKEVAETLYSKPDVDIRESKREIDLEPASHEPRKPAVIETHKTECFAEKKTEPSESDTSRNSVTLRKQEEATAIDNIPDITPISSICSEIEKNVECSLGENIGSVSENIAHNIPCSTEETEKSHTQKINLTVKCPAKSFSEISQELKNNVQIEPLLEKYHGESDKKLQNTSKTLETLSESIIENTDSAIHLLDQKKHNENIATTDESLGKIPGESEINLDVNNTDMNTNQNSGSTIEHSMEKDRHLEDANSPTIVGEESIRSVQLSDDVSNALPDSTIQFTNEIYDKLEATSEEIPDSTNNVGAETKLEFADNSVNQTGLKIQEPTTMRSNDQCTPMDALGSILSILTDKSKIKEILNLLGDNSSTSDKIKRKLAKLTEIESDDDEEETSKPSTNSTPQNLKIPNSDTTQQGQAIPAPKQDECVVKTYMDQLDLNSEPNSEQNAQEPEPEHAITNAGQNVIPEEVSKVKECEVQPPVTRRAKGKQTKKAKKKAVAKKNDPKKVFVKKRITRQSVAIKGNSLLKSPNAKMSLHVGKVSKAARPPRKRLDELQKLQVDIREMFISDDVLSATGIRNCRITKLTDTINCAAMKKDTELSTDAPSPLQKTTKPKKGRKRVAKNKDNCNTLDNKAEENITPFVVIKGINPEFYKKAKSTIVSDEATTFGDDKSLDNTTKTKQKSGPKSRTSTTQNLSVTKTTLGSKYKAIVSLDGTSSESLIQSISSKTTTNLNEKPVVLRPGPKSKKLLCLQNMLQQNQDTIAVDEIQDIILGLRDNSNKTVRKYNEHRSSPDSEDEVLSTLASRRTKYDDKDPSAKTLADPPRTEQPLSLVAENQLVDKKYCFDSLKSNYDCKLCKYNGNGIVHHYKDCHPHDEILISRISPEILDRALKFSLNLDVDNTFNVETNNQFQCRFCLKNFTEISLKTFFWHVVKEHTGEYNYDCLLCTDEMANAGECKQASLAIPEPPKPSNKYLLGYVCELCSFTQVSEKNVKDHITVYHKRSNVKTHAINLCNISISPELGLETTDKLSPVSNMVKKRKLRLKKHVDSSIPSSKGDKILSSDDGSISSDKESSGNYSETSKMNAGHRSSLPTGSSHDGITSDTSNPSRTGTRQKIINQLTPSPTTVSEESDDDMFIKIGSIGIVKLLSGGVEYCCNVSKCPFRSARLISFSSHLLNAHGTDRWNGDCKVCKQNVKGVDGRYSHKDELNHLVQAHMDDLDQQIVETTSSDVESISQACASIQDEVAPKTNEERVPFENNGQESHPAKTRTYINVRPFSELSGYRADHFESEPSSVRRQSSSREYMNTDNDSEFELLRGKCCKENDLQVNAESENELLSVPHIEEVVSLDPAELGPIGRTSPLASIASSWLEKEDGKSPKISTVASDIVLPTIRAMEDIETATTTSNVADGGVLSESVCSSSETSTIFDKEGDNSSSNVTSLKPSPNTDISAHPVFAAKSPKVARKMMVAKKQVHPFKCGGRFCSYTTHDTSAFSAHLNAHEGIAPGVRCCVYCPFEATGEIRALMQHVFTEHAHCQFACVYCPYVSTSSILVEMHRTGAHPEKAPAVLRLHTAHNNVLTVGSRGALSRSEAVHPYICKQRIGCKFQCLTSAQFVSHLAEHKATQFQCSKCSLTFPRTSHLIRHMRQHGLCLYQCTYCVFGADAEHDMLKHIAKEHPMRRAQAYLRHMSSNSVESNRIGLPLVNMEKKFNGKIQVCESKYTEDPIAEAEAADKLNLEYETHLAHKLHLEYETQMATEFLTNQSKEQDTSINVDMETQAPSADLLTEMPCISFVTSIANINMSGSIATASEPTVTVENTTGISKNSADVQEHSKSDQFPTVPKNVVNIKNLATLQISDVAKSPPKTNNEGIICLDSDGEDNSELIVPDLDLSALKNIKKTLLMQPEVNELKITPVEKTYPAKKPTNHVITLSDDETQPTKSPPANISTSDVLQNESNPPPVISEESSNVKKIVDSTLLFRCSKCDMSTRAAYNFSMHLTKCYLKEKKDITCYHCQAIVADTHLLIVHLIEHHSESKLYKCGVCQYIEWTEPRFRNHMKSAHLANTEIPIDSDSQIIVIHPRKRLRKGPKPVVKAGPKSKVKQITKLAISDVRDLPRTPIVNDSMYCVKCSFETKVTSNMARHLQYHESQLPVASSEPVNPVPHLESNEMHFDKMTNLAASSNVGRGTEKHLLKEKPRSVPVHLHNVNPSNYPRYVQDHERYACGAIGCNYLSLDEDILKCHWETLHAEETNFKCPHCPVDQQLNNDKPLTSGRIAAHLKMHDNRLYVCSLCPYYHYHKHYVERHVTDKHLPVDRASLQCLREPPGLASSADDAAKGPPTMDLKPWCCGFCSFKTMLRGDIIEHCGKVHNVRSQYKCGLCNFNHANELNIKKHQSLFHAGSLSLNLISVYFKANRPSTEEMDGSPSWWKQRKRGPGDEPGNDLKRMKVAESNTLKSNQSVNLDLVKEEPLENMDAIQLSDKSLNNANAEGSDADKESEISAYTFVCPLCTTYKDSDVEAMKSHLYEELNYRKWGCNVCSYKSFERDRLVKHIMVEHGVVQEPRSLPQDQRIEQWISTVISMQENYPTTSEKNKTIVYLMRILPRIENIDNQTQNTTESGNQSTSDQKSKTKDIRKTKSLENQIKKAVPSSAVNKPIIRFPKVDILPKNPLSTTQTNTRTPSTENESRSLLKLDAVGMSQGSDKEHERLENQPTTSDTHTDITQDVATPQRSSQELVNIFGSFGESKGYRFVCPKCHYGVDNEDSMRKHLEYEINIHLYKCDLCHLNFNSVSMYVKHYIERHNGGTGPNKVSIPGIMAQAQEWMNALLHLQGQSIAAYISTHGPDPAPDCPPSLIPQKARSDTKPTEGRKRRHSHATGSDSDNDSSDEERLVIIEPSKSQVEKSAPKKVSLNPELSSTTEVSSDDQSSSKKTRIDQPSKAKSYKCPHCYFVTRYSTCLVDHISRHFNDRPFKCGHCEYKHYRKQVKEHSKRIHPNEVPIVIKIQFPDKPLIINLEKEKSTRQNIIKVCLLCEASLLPQQISSHFNILHPEAKKALALKGDTVYRCNDCALMLQTLDDTTEHFHSVHPRCRVNYVLHKVGGGEPQSYLCNHCSNMFPHMKDLCCHHERAHADLELDFADLGPSESTVSTGSEVESTSTTEISKATDVTKSDSQQCGFSDTANKVVRYVAKKSTTKLPPSMHTHAVARKSTTKLPLNIEQLVPFSAYGRKPDQNVGHLTTKMPFYGTLMPFTVQKLKDIINISPVVLVEDIEKKVK